METEPAAMRMLGEERELNDTNRAVPPDGRRPRPALPEGATDAHFHVFGPSAAYPYSPEREYTPQDALPATAEQLFAAAGISRAVLIQASVYGRDNRRHLDAAAEMAMPTRVVVVTDAETPERDLADMHEKGARGVRFIMSHRGGLRAEDLSRIAARLETLGWHVQLMMKPPQLVELENDMAALPCPVVIDHLGMIEPAAGLDQPAMRALLRLLDGGRCHVKLSGYYRLSATGAPFADMAPIVGALLRAAPDRLVWGSDWPHPHFSGPIPSLAELIDPLFDWIPEEALRRRVLVDNPARLYGFEAAEARQPHREMASHG